MLRDTTLYETIGVMNAPISMLGKRFGRLLVVANAPDVVFDSGRKLRKVIANCDCGAQKAYLVCHLRAGKTQSCGCLRKEVVAELHSTHGDTRPSKGKWTPEYVAWSGMIARCKDMGAKNRPYYADRGITICERWLTSYENFLADMGRKPPGLYSLDRINSDGNYEPGNCRWATSTEQRLNSRNPKRGFKRKH